MTEYVESLHPLGGNKRRDIWDGTLMTELRTKKHLFKNPTDLAFLFSTDGVRVFKSRSLFSVWPLILINYNLSPKERVKNENVLILGIIPGPNQPKDIDSFLRPMINEFKVWISSTITSNRNLLTALQVLQSSLGVPRVWNANTKEYFTLRAHIVTICGDTPARDKLSGASGTVILLASNPRKHQLISPSIGSGSYTYCTWCKAWGVYNGHIYCPFTIPIDPPPEALSKPPAANWHSIAPSNLRIKSNTEVRRIAFNSFKNDDWVHGKLNGVSRFSIFSELYSLDFVKSFALDAMHLYWENVVPTLFDLWRGKFFTPTRNSEQNADRGRKTRTSNKKFWNTDDVYNVKEEQWHNISADMQDSSKLIPVPFGAALRPIDANFGTYKANEWQNWALFVAPVLLKGALEDQCYQHFMRLVSAFTTSMDTSIVLEDIMAVKEDIIAFIEHYESTYY